jgi:hypothetical protein
MSYQIIPMYRMNELFSEGRRPDELRIGPSRSLSSRRLCFIAVWAACGPYFGYSDAWQLVINTSTTIGTFLMLFVLQNSQNRDTKSINIKLDELLRALSGARNRLVDLKDASDDELEKLKWNSIGSPKWGAVPRRHQAGERDRSRAE